MRGLQQSIIILGAFFVLVYYLESQGVTDNRSRIKNVLLIAPQIINIQNLVGDGVETDASIFERLEFTEADIHVNGHIIQINNASEEFTARSFRVHLILHSHVDPGWLRTFEEYYKEKVHTILDGAVAGLKKHVGLKFIWSEMSFLERWWRDANETMRNDFRDLVSSGRLELCGGAWVMTDEATPHFFSTIDNMIEGQQYIHKLLNVTPRTSWSVDPFGHGLMLPLLNPLSGIENMVVGRLNDGMKNTMRKMHTLRWKWKQPYEMGEADQSPNVNTLPYMYYTTINACGPSEPTCCEAHVGVSVKYYYCQGGMDRYLKNNQQKQFKEYAAKLVSQWKILQTLYDSDEILVPIGDDFYLSDLKDWEVVGETWREMLKVVNANPAFGVKVQFSTVSEFFDSINGKKELPTLTGDFFPYVGNENNPQKYWVGFYTHRPHHKRMERVVMNQLRSLDLLQVTSKQMANSSRLTVARRDLALFQHHDGITGTSKPHVMEDYLQRLRKSSSTLLEEQVNLVSNVLKVDKDKIITSLRSPQDADREQPPHNVFAVETEKKLTLAVFNQLPSVTRQKVIVFVDSVNVEVTDGESNVLDAQVSPRYNPNGTVYEKHFELIFYADLSPLALNMFVLENKETESTVMAKLSVPQGSSIVFKEFEQNSIAQNEELNKKNKYVQLNLGSQIEISSSEDPTQNVLLNYETYDDQAGAYVFEGREKKQVMRQGQLLYIADGPLETQVVHVYKEATILNQVIRLNHAGDSEHLSKAVQVQLFPKVEDNQNLFMRLTANITNARLFNTDINAMYMLKREYNPQKNLAANIFATPTAGFIQDSLARLTVLTGQPAGMTSKESGSLLVHVDRQVLSDDGKGLSYGDAVEHHLAHPHYRILLEPRSSSESSGGCHSVNAHRALESMLHPPAVFAVKGMMDEGNFSPSQLSSWPCSIQLVNMRYIDEKQVLVILKRISFDESTTSKGCSNDMSTLWPFLSSFSSSISHCSLTGTKLFGSASEESLLSKLEQPLSITTLLLAL